MPLSVTPLVTVFQMLIGAPPWSQYGSVRFGPTLPSPAAPWQTTQNCSKILRPSSTCAGTAAMSCSVVSESSCFAILSSCTSAARAISAS